MTDDREAHDEPFFDDERGVYVCAVCDRDSLMEHPDRDDVVVCIVDGVWFDKPDDGQWP
jgi:hypothetical protein